MLKNYISLVWRTLLKHRSFSVINITGLAIGISAFWLILRYVSFETSYENFNPISEDVYRVQLDVYRNSELVYKSSENYPGVGAALVEDIPEVISYGRLYNMGSKNNVVISNYDVPSDPIQLKQTKFLYSDASSLDLLGTELLYGNSENALEEPFTMVISETMAENYFSGEDPMGKFLRLEDDDFNDELCKITGVFKDPPPNTHLKFHVLISTATLYGRDNGQGWATRRYKNGWGRKDFYTYVQLQQGTDPASVEEMFPELIEKYNPELIREEGNWDEMSLQKVSDIHLNSRLTDEAEVNGSWTTVYYLAIIAGFILIIAWINYINLSTAKAMDRAKEVGLRKVLGSHKKLLVFQFIFESIAINALAMIVAVIMVLIATPLFDQMGGTPSGYLLWNQPWFWGSAFVILIFGGLAAGAYPAFVLSSYKPISVLRGRLKTSSQGVVLRRILVVIQFTASITLIIGTSIVFQQMGHMQNRDLGFSPEQIIVVQRPAIADTSRQVNINKFNSFKSKLEGYQSIDGVAISMSLPGKKLRFKTGVRIPRNSSEEAVPFAINLMDYNYHDMMEMELVAGRNFSKDFTNDPDTAVVINETGLRALGFQSAEEAIGQNVVLDEWEWRPVIIGVLKDFHQESLQEPIVPILTGVREFGLEYIMVKTKTSGIKTTLSIMEDTWKASFSGNPFDYFFLDEYFNSYYESERQFMSLFTVFSVLAILVGCLGLFGLTLFSTNQKAKEIGIRKVLGASISGVILLLVKDVLVLLALANLIAWPLSYFSMNEWLNNYPYKTNIGFENFIFAGFTVFVVALITVSIQTLKSAQANPVESLKDE